MNKVLISIPVRDRAWILPEYLDRISKLDLTDVEVYYYFIVDESVDDSLRVLTEITKDWVNCEVESVENDDTPPDDPSRMRSYRLKNGIYSHLKALREKIMKKGLELGVDYLFSADSDVMVEPDCLQRLLSHKLDFVYLAGVNNVEDVNSYVIAFTLKGNPNNIFSKLRIQNIRLSGSGGLVPVLCAGTGFLVSKKVLENCSLYFEPESNAMKLLLEYNGEDVWLGVSAALVDIPRFLDEGCICKHIYSKSKYQSEVIPVKKRKAKDVEVQS